MIWHIKTKTSEQGYVTLLSVLILGTVATAVATALLVAGADANRETLIVQQSTQARGYVDACVEDALQQIHDNTSFTGTDGLVLGQGTCSYTVASTGATTRTIATAATVGGVTRKAMIYVTMTSSTISITTWQEVN